ncbi:hypothetical protein KDA_55690 [Dictyobacter alpinus]|uniref:Cupin type-2 domain-containing protein n=1 Tax=Dictyobacter alpinus TaxID=2014873 RepID=A0A402BFC0_9CHLR|nr:cupin domain-containing protein [Dictyobacter alpinus]GCE30085.1 hypothetical protein KDA_55690 [Dictyobacter alpinus]
MENSSPIQVKQVPGNLDVYAPDRTEIRLLARMNGGSMVHCTLPPGQVSRAGMHHTVEEIWYALQGEGDVWLYNQHEEHEEHIVPTTCFTLPVKTHFQVRNTGLVPLCFVITTMPSWPGEQEWTRVPEHWSAQ